jgi:hypothetical protein
MTSRYLPPTTIPNMFRSIPNLPPDYLIRCGTFTSINSNQTANEIAWCNQHPYVLNCSISSCTQPSYTYGGTAGMCNVTTGWCMCPGGYSGIDFLAWYNDCHVLNDLRVGMGWTALAFNILAVIATLTGMVLLFLMWGVLLFPNELGEFNTIHYNANDDFIFGGGARSETTPGGERYYEGDGGITTGATTPIAGGNNRTSGDTTTGGGGGGGGDGLSSPPLSRHVLNMTGGVPGAGGGGGTTTPLSSAIGGSAFNTSVVLTIDGDTSESHDDNGLNRQPSNPALITTLALDGEYIHRPTTTTTTSTTIITNNKNSNNPVTTSLPSTSNNNNTASPRNNNNTTSSLLNPRNQQPTSPEKSIPTLGKRSSSNTAHHSSSNNNNNTTPLSHRNSGTAAMNNNNLQTTSQRSNAGSSQQHARDLESSSARYSDAQGSMAGGGYNNNNSNNNSTNMNGGIANLATSGSSMNLGSGGTTNNNNGAAAAGDGGGTAFSTTSSQRTLSRKRNSSRVPTVNFNELQMPPPNVHSQDYRTKVFERKKRRHSTLVLLLGLLSAISGIIVYSMLLTDFYPFESQNWVVLLFSFFNCSAVVAMVWLFMYSVFNPVIKNVSRHGAFLRPELGDRFLYRQMEKNPLFIKNFSAGTVILYSLVSFLFWVILCLSLMPIDVDDWIISVVLTLLAIAAMLFWIFCWQMCSLALAIFKCELAHRLEQQHRNLNPMVRNQPANPKESSIVTKLPIRLRLIISIATPLFAIPALIVAWEPNCKANFYFFFSYLGIGHAIDVIGLTIALVSVRTETRKGYSGSRDSTGGR